MELEIDVLTNASGSARFRVANTDVLVGIKTEITIPTVEKPDEGKLEFFVNCSSTATPAFEGRGGEVMANQISGLLANAYKSSKAFDLKSLCILPKHKSWKLFIDIMVSRNWLANMNLLYANYIPNRYCNAVEIYSMLFPWLLKLLCTALECRK